MWQIVYQKNRLDLEVIISRHCTCYTLCLVYTLVPWYFSNFKSNFNSQVSTVWKVLNDSPSSSGGDLSAPNSSETKVNCTPGGNRWEPTWSALHGKFQRRILCIVSSFKSQRRIKVQSSIAPAARHTAPCTSHKAYCTCHNRDDAAI